MSEWTELHLHSGDVRWFTPPAEVHLHLGNGQAASLPGVLEARIDSGALHLDTVLGPIVIAPWRGRLWHRPPSAANPKA